MNTRDIMTDASRKEALGLFLGMLGSQTENKVVLDSLLKEIQDQQNAIAAALVEVERLRGLLKRARRGLFMPGFGQQTLDAICVEIDAALAATPTAKES